MIEENENAWAYKAWHIFRPRTDLTVASCKRFLKAKEHEQIFFKDRRYTFIEFPRHVVSYYGVLCDTAEDLSKHYKCPVLVIEAGWDELFRWYIYINFSDKPNGRFTKGLKGGREKASKNECSPDFSVITQSIPCDSSIKELSSMWENCTPMEILDGLSSAFKVYLGGKDYRQFAENQCKLLATYIHGDVFRFCGNKDTRVAVTSV